MGSGKLHYTVVRESEKGKLHLLNITTKIVSTSQYPERLVGIPAGPWMTVREPSASCGRRDGGRRDPRREAPRRRPETGEAERELPGKEPRMIPHV